MFDSASLFSNDEVQYLKDEITKFSVSTLLDFVVLTTDDFLGEDNQENIATSFYGAQCLSVSGTDDGVIFYIDMDQRIQFFKPFGSVALAMDDDDIEGALDKSDPYLRKGEYVNAIIAVMRYISGFVKSE